MPWPNRVRVCVSPVNVFLDFAKITDYRESERYPCLAERIAIGDEAPIRKMNICPCTMGRALSFVEQPVAGVMHTYSPTDSRSPAFHAFEKFRMPEMLMQCAFSTRWLWPPTWINYSCIRFGALVWAATILLGAFLWRRHRLDTCGRRWVVELFLISLSTRASLEIAIFMTMGKPRDPSELMKS